MHALATFIMRGRVQAIGSIVSLALLSLIVPPLAVFTTAGVALVTLVHGYREGLYSLVIATVVMAVFTALSLGQISIGIEFAVKFWMPAWFFASIVVFRASMSFAILVAGALSCLLVLSFYMFADPAAHWLELINKQLLPMLKDAGIKMQTGEKAEALWLFMSQMMTGSALALFLILQSMSLLLARWWQALLYNPGGFAKEFQQLRFGAVTSNIVLALCLFAITVASELALNLIIIVVVLMMIQGLAVIHNLVSQRKLGVAWLSGLYFLIIFTLQMGAIGILLVAVIGLSDNWLNLRLRLGAKKAPNDLD